MKKYVVLLLLSLIIAPVTVSAANYLLGDRRGNWQTADRSSAGLLPNASEHSDALIRVLLTGLCGTDLHIYDWDSWAQKTIKVPTVAGREFVGRTPRQHGKDRQGD